MFASVAPPNRTARYCLMVESSKPTTLRGLWTEQRERRARTSTGRLHTFTAIQLRFPNAAALRSPCLLSLGEDLPHLPLPLRRTMDWALTAVGGVYRFPDRSYTTLTIFVRPSEQGPLSFFLSHLSQNARILRLHRCMTRLLGEARNGL